MGQKTASGMSKVAIVPVMMVALSMIVLQGAEATTYFVGDTVAWTIPPNGAATYSNWSSSYTFNVGDILGKTHMPCPYSGTSIKGG